MLMELVSADDFPVHALVVVAHPDDIDFGFAGTAAALTSGGAKVTYALCTSGEAGIPEDMHRDELRMVREEEQYKAAAVVGVDDVRFLGMPDGALEYNLELRKVISRVIREVKPDLVITQSPERRWDRVFASHPDHLACANATIAAVYPDARNPHSHPELLDEGYEPHTVPWMWILGGPTPNLAVDITDHVGRKIEALSSHSSQVGWIDDVGKLIRDWASDTANRYGLTDHAPMVEVFTKVKTS